MSFAQEIVPFTKPNKTQKLQMKRAYGMFMHYGVNTFMDEEWSDGTIPVEKYAPTELDCDQWVKVARDAGFRYVLLTTKHHDGFCLWDSKYTNYDVGAAKVKTDIVAEVAKACKKYGLGFAVYYSLWDRHEPSFNEKDNQMYIDFMKNQLTELFTNYGPICELWFDGGWKRKPDEWGIDQVYKLVKKLQPNCAIAVNHTIVNKEGDRKFAHPDSMTVDNKYFFHYFPSDFRLWDPKIANKADKKQYLHKGKSYYLPYEHTICLSKEWAWFAKQKPGEVRDLDELEELFYWCTDNDNMLVIDVPPAHTGKIYETDANAVIALGKRLNLKKNKPLPKNGTFISYKSSTSASSVYSNNPSQFGSHLAVDGGLETRWAANDTLPELIINLNPNDRFNKISIFEYQDVKKSPDPKDFFSNYRFNRIQAYKIDIFKNDKWITVFSDDRSMGDCKVIRFPVYYQTSKLKLRVTKATAPPSIYEINVIDK
jgi:alpha-L-fucosidase